MDPTAPKDNSLSPDPQTDSPTVGEPPNPIQPGQFIVAGGDETHNTPSPAPTPSLNVSPGPLKPQAMEPPKTAIPPQPVAPPPPPPPPPPPKFETTPPSPAPPPPPPPVSQPPAPPVDAGTQPDPTPYVPPEQQGQVPMGPQEEPSKIGKLRTFAIIAAILVLLALVAGIIWFFIINKKEEPVKTQTSPEEQVEEPQPPLKRTDGGFADLPTATVEATPQVTPSPLEEIPPVLPLPGE